MAEFTLRNAPVVVRSFGGFGVQLNQHVFAKQTLDLVPEGTKDDLKAKIRALAPHVVRIFWSNDQEGVPLDPSRPRSPVNRPQGPLQKNRWESFVEVVAFAQEIGATINLTWQGGSLVTEQDRTTAAARLANVIEILVKGGATNLRWVTIANEPNTPPGRPPQKMTPERNGATYRKLAALLEAKGLRGQVRFMGGDLIEGPDAPSPYNQAVWFAHLAENMQNLVDAVSAHIYWDYDAVPRFEKRLTDVCRILNGHTSQPQAKTLQYAGPVFITEYGTRSKDRNPKLGVDPGNFHGGTTVTPLCETRISAFQAAWFQIRAAQLGFAGMLKWDCHFGKYDKGSQQYYVIGPDRNGRKGWALQPGYHLLRLFTITTAAGWKVLQVVPEQPVPGSGTKHLVAFAGPGATMTVIGLDEGGSRADKAPPTPVRYEIGGLPPGRYDLVVWNKDGRGGLVIDQPVTVTAAGVAPISVPMRSVFALTSKELPAF